MIPFGPAVAFQFGRWLPHWQFGDSQGSGPPVETYHLTLEDGSGSLLLESGDFLLLESAP